MAATTFGDMVTVVTNLAAATRYYGYLSSTGVSLTSGGTYTYLGDLTSAIRDRSERDYVKFLADQTAGNIEVLTRRRSIRYCAVDDTTVIAIGDLLYLATDDVRPAALFTWDTDLATTRAAFTNVFMGVALAAHANGGGAVTDFPVDISPDSIYTFTCTSETHIIGDTMAPKKDSGNALLSNVIEKVATASQACMRSAQQNGSAGTTCKVVCQSAYYGANAAGAQ